jgi:hypothetical protein
MGRGVKLVPVVAVAAPREQEPGDAAAQTVTVTGDAWSLVQAALNLLPMLGPAPTIEFHGPSIELASQSRAETGG